MTCLRMGIRITEVKVRQMTFSIFLKMCWNSSFTWWGWVVCHALTNFHSFSSIKIKISSNLMFLWHEWSLRHMSDSWKFRLKISLKKYKFTITFDKYFLQRECVSRFKFILKGTRISHLYFPLTCTVYL